MIIELPIFCQNEKTLALSKLGKDINFNDFDIKFCTFYNISAICPFSVKDTQYSEIFIGENRFITPLTYQELKLQIESE